MGSARLQEKHRVTPNEFNQRLKDFMGYGYTHLIAITAVDRGSYIEALYHLGDLSGRVEHLSVELPKGNPVLPDISPLVPGAAFYEREVSDLFGVRFEGLGEQGRFILPDCYPREAPPPLLKDTKPETVREYLSKATTCEVQAVTMQAPLSPESVVVPFGPYHPALKEPEHLSLVVEGEVIKKAFVRIGFVHRGIEKAAESRTFLRDVFLLERVCGICSTHHAWTFVEAVERLLGIDPPKRAHYLRTLVAELERMHSHSLWLGLVGYWMGFESMFMWVWGMRETIMDILEELTGNRVHKSFVTIGGVRRDVGDEKLKSVAQRVAEFEKSVSRVLEEIVSVDEFIERTRNVGSYNVDQARSYVTVGPVRRAAGDPYDVRRIEPYGAYGELDFEVVMSNKGDVFNLVLVRLKELEESAGLVGQIVAKMPSGNPVPQRYFMGTVPEGEAYARTEAPRGELFYYVNSNNTHSPYRVKIRTPTLPNIQLAASILEGATLSDLPLIVTSIDPCFSCMDRVQVYDTGSGAPRVLTLDDFVRKTRGRRVMG
ncbi:hydrogenase large subunit [Infirmifilum sp. NZ]|uniref:hydrogenase large subunit n=1 Tax=Infirmifilum sp. NZ TaxID=2926850 RepID=UPI0027AB4B17|nr:NADH-quinone oxidoreductase subunit C [Infirmifilum sp. NZ]UNQ73097.1 NADH-quinone oxidoreductase subunit C [Infirmifilum sp. NZ]